MKSCRSKDGSGGGSLIIEASQQASAMRNSPVRMRAIPATERRRGERFPAILLAMCLLVQPPVYEYTA